MTEIHARDPSWVEIEVPSRGFLDWLKRLLVPGWAALSDRCDMMEASLAAERRKVARMRADG